MTKHEGADREMPNAHVYHILSPIIFITIWMLDSSVFNFSIWLNEFVPLLLRIIIFAIVLGLALTFIQLSHKTLFKGEHKPSDTLLTSGVVAHVRNPMYLGILLIFVAFLFLSISIICVILFIPIFLIYNKMANFEANILEGLFGEEFLKYKEKVPKWIPSIKKRV